MGEDSQSSQAAIYILVQLYTYAIWIYCYPANSNVANLASHVKRKDRVYYAVQFKYPNRWKIAASSTTDDSFGRAQWVCTNGCITWRQLTTQVSEGDGQVRPLSDKTLREFEMGLPDSWYKSTLIFPLLDKQSTEPERRYNWGNSLLPC
jgi:hypothetical protein